MGLKSRGICLLGGFKINQKKFNKATSKRWLYSIIEYLMSRNIKFNIGEQYEKHEFDLDKIIYENNLRFEV